MTFRLYLVPLVFLIRLFLSHVQHKIYNYSMLYYRCQPLTDGLILLVGTDLFFQQSAVLLALISKLAILRRTVAYCLLPDGYMKKPQRYSLCFLFFQNVFFYCIFLTRISFVSIYFAIFALLITSSVVPPVDTWNTEIYLPITFNNIRIPHSNEVISGGYTLTWAIWKTRDNKNGKEMYLKLNLL